MTTAGSRYVRVVEIALWVNAVLHLSGTIGMALGLGPHAGDQPDMARRAAAAGLAAVPMFVLVSRRLRADPKLVALPLAFVICQLTATIVGFVMRRDPQELGPLVPEATFTALYTMFTIRYARTPEMSSSAMT